MEGSIKWIRRLVEFKDSLERLTETAQSETHETPPESKVEMIRAFHVTYDLSIETLRELFREENRPESEKVADEVLGLAIEDGIINYMEGGHWSAAMHLREWTAGDYDRYTGTTAVSAIRLELIDMFRDLETRLIQEI